MNAIGRSLSAALTCLLLAPAASALAGNSWQKRLDRAFLQVDGISPGGRVRSFQRALRDPQLRRDVSRAVEAVRERGFGKGHPEFIEILWPEGTQARRDLEAINALTKQLPERRDEVSEESSNLLEIVRSVRDSVKFGEEGASGVASSLFESVQSDPNRALELAKNALRNEPAEVESPTYEVLGTYAGDASESFLAVPPLELRRYDAFRSASVPLGSADGTYTLRNMGASLAELFSYAALGNNDRGALASMTAPFVISESSDAMFVKVPEQFRSDPPAPFSSDVTIEEFPETVLATLSFPGVCTDGEVERQKARLMERIEGAGAIGYQPKVAPEYYVTQYNAPGTVPWRRNNEIAVAMEAVDVEADAAETVAVAEAEAEEEAADSLTEEGAAVEADAAEPAAEAETDEAGTGEADSGFD